MGEMGMAEIVVLIAIALAGGGAMLFVLAIAPLKKGYWETSGYSESELFDLRSILLRWSSVLYVCAGVLAVFAKMMI